MAWTKGQSGNPKGRAVEKPFADALSMEIKAADHLLLRAIARKLLKRAAADILPADVVYAEKKGFPVPASFWAGAEGLIQDGALAEAMQWSPDTTRRPCRSR